MPIVGALIAHAQVAAVPGGVLHGKAVVKILARSVPEQLLIGTVVALVPHHAQSIVPMVVLNHFGAVEAQTLNIDVRSPLLILAGVVQGDFHK